jgi:signal transduction histidine kinase
LKVSTRITAATSLVVALTLLVFMVLEQHAGWVRDRRELELQARDTARLVRAMLESRGGAKLTVTAANELGRDLSRSLDDWSIAVLPRSLVGSALFETGQIRRLRTLLEAHPDHLYSQVGDTVVYTLPLRAPVPTPEGTEIVGAIEVSRTTDELATSWVAEIWRALPALTGIVFVVIVALVLLTRTAITSPIEKLLAGVGDVAAGDLSHVLLFEREDEIGALASRFNDMTQSLRESRAETERQNRARVALEQRLLKTEKMATIGQLAAEIAHEVGTPLNVIAARARGLARRAADPGVVAKNAHIIAEQASRITRIIQRLLDLARRKVGVIERESVDVAAVCKATLDFLEGRMATSGVSFRLETSARLPRVDGYGDQLQQVFINLVINAIEAMPQGGSLTVRIRTVSMKRPGLDVAPEQACVVVDVIDTGVGIPEQLRDKIFEPFYTSKDREGGTGLGLAVSWGIIKEHDGWIEVESAPKSGTVFRVCLPALQDV